MASSLLVSRRDRRQDGVMAGRITFWQILGDSPQAPGHHRCPRWKGRAAVNKRTIALLTLAAIALLLTAFIGFGPAFATQFRSYQTATTNPNPTNSLPSPTYPSPPCFVPSLSIPLT